MMAFILNASCGLGVICFVNTLDDEKVDGFVIFFSCIPKQLYLEWNTDSDNKKINGENVV